MWYVDYITKNIFHDKSNIKLFEKKKVTENRVPQKSHFVIAKFRILKRLKA